MILRQHGYAVSSANLHDAIELCLKESFDAAIIGHSTPNADQQKIAAALRQACPEVIVLALRRNPADRIEYANAWTHSVRTK